ncbi:MAG: 3-dehydroquinate synthase [Ignavibacteriales bacterium]|nr:3-dehydroquinate synthase [Ignavibacteriales bacterium]
MVEHTIRVELGDRSYPVYTGGGILGSLANLLDFHGIPKQLVVITDRNVAHRYLPPIQRHLVSSGYAVTPIVVPPGESQKSLSTAGRIYAQMLRARVGRGGAVLALGGGVIGDLAGFVAATYHRGIALVHVPTTLLSQVDSSIGGKTAVNHALGKNMIGAFHQPRVVISDIDVLQTLPAREVICGLGEIVKYGIILDEELFSWLESAVPDVLALKKEALIRAQSRCVELKASLVSRDERETGERVILNCGHTIGHALEAAGNYRLLKHGEAVLLGLVAESFLALQMNLLPQMSYDRISRLIAGIPLRQRFQKLKRSVVLSMIGRDKKAVGRRNRFVLPVRIGQTRVVENVSASLIGEALGILHAFSAKPRSKKHSGKNR